MSVKRMQPQTKRSVFVFVSVWNLHPPTQAPLPSPVEALIHYQNQIHSQSQPGYMALFVVAEQGGWAIVVYLVKLLKSAMSAWTREAGLLSLSRNLQ